VDEPKYSAPPAPPVSPISKSCSTSIAVLDYPRNIFSVEGSYRLPFFSCEDRIYRFFGDNGAGLATLLMYQNIRQNAPAERWTDSIGGTLSSGRVQSIERPSLSFGRVLNGLQARSYQPSWIVFVLKAKIMKNFRAGDNDAHLDGDFIYQWVRYPSLSLAESGLVEEIFPLGCSVVASWVEVPFFVGIEQDMVGKTIVDAAGTKTFAIVEWLT